MIQRKTHPFTAWLMPMAFALLLALELLSGHAFSTRLAQWGCGSNYLSPVNGIVGDGSCGFNADMQFTAFLLIGGLLSVAATRWFAR